MKTMASLIREHLFLVGIDEAHVETVAGCARNVVYNPGTYIFREGQPADAFFLIRHGRVALEVYAPTLGERVVQTLGPQEILGEAWLVPPYVHDFDARATETVRAFAFDAGCLRGKCEADPALGYTLMKRFVPILVQHLQAARLQVMDVYATAR
jgi:CRP/FNR family cyclic AMP-dependent transcriptional regulator